MKALSFLLLALVSLINFNVPRKLPKLLNPKLLQSKVETAESLFESPSEGIMPTSMLLDFREDKVAAVTLTFSLLDKGAGEISIEDCRKAIETDYARRHNLQPYGLQNSSGGLWRNSDRSLIVHLVKSEDADELQIFFLSK